ncbi:MAG: hypothetical protein ACK456_00330 [Pseudanabaenaceae cyanobacterium]|jgi:hypothetical protein
MLHTIDHEIQQVHDAIAKVTAQIAVVRLGYASALEQAVRQYFLQAVFDLCTRHYPTSFLGLTLAERQKFQSQLQDIGYQLAQGVRQHLDQTHISEQGDPEQIDRCVGDLLKQTTVQVNHLLQEKQILPNPLPENAKSLELRLPEIEFTSRSVMGQRGELRVLSARLRHLGNELEKKQKAKHIAEAELAWRAAWVEKSPNDYLMAMAAAALAAEEAQAQENAAQSDTETGI